MQLQISTYEYDGERADLHGYGHVYVSGEGVSAYFHFGSRHGVDRAGAERQAQFFADAVSAEVFGPVADAAVADFRAAVEADFCKAVSQ